MNPKKKLLGQRSYKEERFLMLEPPNLQTLEEKIRGNIQIRSKNITKINFLPELTKELLQTQLLE